jgi:luciferase family oxidoreductase group 1
MSSIASSATSVLIAHIAAHTETIRLGAGGVMLPNHSPLTIAEQFGTLETLHPGRIDLGLGRAPGSDHTTARALRRNLASDADEFPQDVVELMDYFADSPRRQVRAVPGAGLDVPVWILGSSLFGAQLAAALGLPYAFADFINPSGAEIAALYRREFAPGVRLEDPVTSVAVWAVAADTDAEAQVLATSMQQAFVNLRSGRPTRLQPPVPGYLESLGTAERMMLDSVLSCTAIGSPATVESQLRSFIARTRPDELMITSQVFDHAARLRAYEITAGIHQKG